MKKPKFDIQISKIFSVVLGLHLLVFSILLIVPGCMTTEEYRQATESAKPKGESIKSTPGVQSSVTQIDPAFNSELDSSATRQNIRERRYPPTRPTSEEEMGSILEPLGDLRDTSHSIYTVQNGDSPWSIANAYGVTLNDLLRVNGFTRETIIYVGQEIVIPGGDVISEGNDDLSVDYSIMDSENKYMVEPGDTLSEIADRYNVTIKALKSINNLSSDFILIGQLLKIPGEGNYISQSINVPEDEFIDFSALDSENIHIVQEGETLIFIAQEYGLKIQELMRINRIINPNKIQPGQSLLIMMPKVTDESSNITTHNESELDPFELLEREDRQTLSVEDLERSLLEEEDKIPVIPIESENSN